jgi:Uma2 family endonuclease
VKLPLYATSGVPWIWLIDPDRRMIEVFESVQGRPTLTITAVADERLVLPPFDGELDLAPMWMPPERPAI